MTLEVQDLVYGSPNQQFMYMEDENKIVSLLCPEFAVTIPDGDCSTLDGLYLSSDSYTDNRTQWSFDSNDVIQSVKCPNNFITIDGASSGRARAVTFSSEKFLGAGSLPTSPTEDEDVTSNTTTYTNATSTKIVWDNAAPPSVGSAVILSDLSAERYQKWTKKRQV